MDRQLNNLPCKQAFLLVQIPLGSPEFRKVYLIFSSLSWTRRLFLVLYSVISELPNSGLIILSTDSPEIPIWKISGDIQKNKISWKISQYTSQWLQILKKKKRHNPQITTEFLGKAWIHAYDTLFPKIAFSWKVRGWQNSVYFREMTLITFQFLSSCFTSPPPALVHSYSASKLWFFFSPSWHPMQTNVVTLVMILYFNLIFSLTFTLPSVICFSLAEGLLLLLCHIITRSKG